ncbi:MAG TPA: ribonuclease HIII [Verrucomicrobiales bacterium]|nr:ribonuclease HIII [Verrucomicrobiales bacterium]HRJ08141.1 ribonuclease HIII [Prosthecobacter sp.]HRK13786.1 ribonuclease HIII [Prosthecobacter sp.]
MPALSTYTKTLTTAQAEKLRGILQEEGWSFEDKAWCLYAASRGKVNVLVYEKGPKAVVQGKETENFVLNTLEPRVLGVAELGYEEVHHPEFYQPHLGVDESGKGDFFGPLVIAGVYADAGVARMLRECGAVDSKQISSDQKIEKLAEAVRAIPGLRWEVVQINPERYNALYEKFGNLNRLLAWGHAKVIELLLEKVPDCPRAVSDQFANPAVLQRALQAKGRGIELVQRTKAESDPAVAAASILARERFVRWLRETGQSIGIALPKGVSPAVKESARRIVASRGADALTHFTKTHFRTTAELLAAS